MDSRLNWKKKLLKGRIMKIKCIHDTKRYQEKFIFCFFTQSFNSFILISPSAFEHLPLPPAFMINHRSISTLYGEKGSGWCGRRRRKNPSWCFCSLSEKCYNFFSFPCHQFNRIGWRKMFSGEFTFDLDFFSWVGLVRKLRQHEDYNLVFIKLKIIKVN